MTRQDVPNLLTHLRIALALLVLAALLTAAFGAELIGDLRVVSGIVFAALAAFVVGSLTDFLDGWLARRWNAGSPWGAMLDPIADKLAVTAAVLGLAVVAPHLTLLVAGGLILLREVFVSGLREGGAARGLSFPVTKLAKWKTTAQLVALCGEMGAAGLRIAEAASGRAPNASAHLFAAADALLWLAAFVTVLTGAQYAAAARRGLAGAAGGAAQPARTSSE